MDYFQITILLAFLFPLAYSPGPGNMFFAANGARFGFRSTLGATTGYHLSTLAVTFAIGSGFASILAIAPQGLLVVKTVGALYVLWLAWKLATAGQPGNPDAQPATILDGAVLLVLNPKAYVIIALMFSQFLTTSSNLWNVAVVSMVFTINNLVAFTIWTLIGDRLGRRLRGEHFGHYLNLGFGGILGTVGIWMLVS